MRLRRPTGLLLFLCLGAAGCGGGGGGGSDPIGGGMQPAATATLQQVQDRVFTPSCAGFGCHVGSSAPFGLDLERGRSFANLVGVTSAELPAYERVEPGNAADSYLFMKVSADPRIVGDPMPFTGGPLDPTELALIESWIEQGALP